MTHRHIAGERDAIDEKLVSLLCQNARMTLTALAKAVSLSRSAVQARIARLEQEKVIIGYRAVRAERTDARTLGAILAITFSQRPCTPVVAKFRHWPEIESYYTVTGPIDAYAVVKVDDAGSLSAFVDRMSAIPGVASVMSAVIL